MAYSFVSIAPVIGFGILIQQCIKIFRVPKKGGWGKVVLLFFSSSIIGLVVSFIYGGILHISPENIGRMSWLFSGMSSLFMYKVILSEK